MRRCKLWENVEASAEEGVLELRGAVQANRNDGSVRWRRGVGRVWSGAS